jgi:hypothetical protein
MPRISTLPMPPAITCERCHSVMRAVVIETESTGYSLTYACSQCGATDVKTQKVPLPPDTPANLA